MRPLFAGPWFRCIPIAFAVLVSISPVRAVAGEFFSDHDRAFNVGLFAGVSFGHKVSFSYGVDLRFGRPGPTPFARIELRTTPYARFTVGVVGVKRGRYGYPAPVGELGWSFLTAPAGTDIGWSSGPHLGLGVGGLTAQLLGQGTLPLLGDRRHWNASLSGVVVVPQLMDNASLTY